MRLIDFSVFDKEGIYWIEDFTLEINLKNINQIRKIYKFYFYYID